jgi:hypothetical protein
MTQLLAWIVFPALLCGVCWSLGALLEAVARAPLHGLRLPVGFCAGIALVGPVYWLGLNRWPALAVLAIAAGAGLWLSRERLRDRGRLRLRPGWAAAAFGAVFLFYLGPVVVTGQATFLGYNFLNDTAVHLVFIDYVGDHGARLVGLEPSSYASAALQHVANGYPFGSHELLATVGAVVPVDVAHLYQPYLAVSAAVAAVAIAAALRDAGLPSWAACVAAVAALSSQLLFSYGLQGGIKELAFVAVLATGAALGARFVTGGATIGHAVGLGIVAAAALGIYGLAAGAWLAPLALGIGFLALLLGTRASRRRLPLAIGAAAVAFAVLGGPLLYAAYDFVDYGEGSLTSQNELGPLLGPIRNIQAAGIWFSGDYRQLDIGSPDGRRTLVFVGLAFGLAALGTAWVVRRRALGAGLLLITTAVSWYVVSRSGSPYVDAKLLSILSPAVVLLACLGVWALWRPGLRIEAAVVGVALFGALLWSDVLAYRIATVAPIERLGELSDIGDRFAGQGPMMVNEFEEYAKHFARKAEPVDPYEAWTPSPAALRDPARPVYANAYTLDELELAYVTSFPLIATRRSPAESQPPAGYERAWSGDYYDVWRRAEKPPAVAHRPLGTPRPTDPVSAVAQPSCDAVREMASAGELLAVERPAAAIASLGGRALPASWTPDPANTLGAIAYAGGTVTTRATTRAGRHRVWVQGRFSRAATVTVDGHALPVERQYNGPKQWVDAGVLELASGVHEVAFSRPGNSWAPGSYQADVVGPIVLTPERPGQPVTAPQGDGEALCAKTLDWVEQR